jgi:hypothetical protein
VEVERLTIASNRFVTPLTLGALQRAQHIADTALLATKRASAFGLRIAQLVRTSDESVR